MTLEAAFAGVRGSGSGGPHVQICAHTDDDLYFMTPDLLQSLRAGTPLVTVYLTGGEGDGLNLASDDPARKTATPDFAGYSAARQHGIRAAYASMVTGNRRAEWTRATLETGTPVVGEVSTLDRGRITLIFLNLRSCTELRNERMLQFWNATIPDIRALRPTGSPIPPRADGRRMTRAGLITFLADLLDLVRPSVVRVMNPDSERTAYRAETDTVTPCDNTDHTAAALFGLAALRVHETRDTAHRPYVESYVGYCNKLRPENLSPAAAAEKFHYLTVYGGEDGHDCLKDPGECGDRVLGNRAFNRYYGQSTTHRWQGTTTWLRLRGDDRLTAFAVLGGRPMVWTQDTPGGDTWTGPEPLGTWPADDPGRCLPRLDTTVDAQGRIHVFAVRHHIDADPENHRREVLHLHQTSPDGDFGTWTVLGSPHDRANAIRRRALGMPVAVTTAEGTPQVLLRNFGTGLSARTSLTEDTFGPWADLAGGSLEGASAITTRDGRTEVYATTRTGMLRWHRTPGHTTFTRDYATLLPRPAGPVALVEQPDGTLIMFSRQPATGWLLAHRRTSPDGAWDPMPELLDTTPGQGPIAASVTPDGTAVVLVQRRDDGTLAHSLQPLDGTPFHTTWTRATTELHLHTPALAHDAHGRPVIATLDTEARFRLHVLQPAPAPARA
ncbi:hypothetical protein ACN20G_35340 (plasmid) [Streptomyces sp. BI20]|uniref:hypothetical protein n=1 Tax=Streptomyces sp. BI20 TaxID=3403460 RepID=UPI003C7802CF